MLVKLSNNEVQFCDLIEHPGGSDGGEFPQYHTYKVAEDGRLSYHTDYPENDSFCEDSPSDHLAVSSREEAVDDLLNRFHALGIETPAQLMAAFAKPAEFTTYFSERVWEGDDAWEEGDEEE